VGDVQSLATLLVAAAVLAAPRDAEAAARALGAREHINTRALAYERQLRGRAEAAVRERLDDAALAEALTAGKALAPELAVQAALNA
jgi:hypothetical protein